MVIPKLNVLLWIALAVKTMVTSKYLTIDTDMLVIEYLLEGGGMKSDS